MVTVKELANGTFDVQDADGRSLLDRMGGPFRLQETAEAARRMLDGFDAVDVQIQQINQQLASRNYSTSNP
jgi:hypothetical protein